MSEAVVARCRSDPARRGTRHPGAVACARPAARPAQPCYDTCTSIVRYSIILVLNTLIGWRAYLILDRPSAVPGSPRGHWTDLLGNFHRFASLGVTKAPHFRRPSRTRGHTVTMTNRGRPGCVAHPSTSRRSSSTASRSTCASSAVVGLGNHFGHQEDGADSSPLVHLLSAAHCSRRLE